MTRLPLAVLLMLATVAPAAAQCAGDCNGDGAVQVNEIVSGVAIALGSADVATCRAADRNGDGQVAIDELLAAVNALLDGCGAAGATPTATSPAATPTATMPDTPTATATPAPNQPPLLPTPFLYHGFADQPIALPLGALDPEGGAVSCSADGLIDGMTLGGDGVLRWTPTDAQLGPQLIPFTCSDSADPPASSSSVLAFQIAAQDSCAMPTCDPASGCTFALPDPGQTCCSNTAEPRVADLAADCPLSRVLEIGQNTDGFGPLQNCDQLRIRNFAQSSSEMDIHIRVRCISPLNRVIVSARLQTAGRGDAVNSDAGVFLPVDPTDGFYERRSIRYPVLGGGPYFDLDGAEANLTVTVSEIPPSTVSVSKTLRVRLTFASIPDLPD